MNRAVAETNRWELSRCATLAAVVALHLALVAALWSGPAARGLPRPAVQAVLLLYLPPLLPPKLRPENAGPRRIIDHLALTILPPVHDVRLPAVSTALSSSPDGGGSGVDWAAEARRALHAYEIRNHQPSINRSISGKPGEDTWWPPGRRRAGEQFKTPNGDWIVWINADCYQVAGSGPSPYALGGSLPQTICRGRSEAGSRE